jgi:DNA-binding PadR family transcriptional regulator
MSLRHAVIGLLTIQPRTGYELAQKFDASIGNAWHASHSQIYPELAKLHEAGMVEVVGEGPRRSRTWAVTDAGHEELRRWMTETEPERTQRSETGVRWFLLALLDPADQRIVIERELAFAAAEFDRLGVVAEQIDAHDPSHPFRATVDLGLRVNSVMQDWLRERLAAPTAPTPR